MTENDFRYHQGKYDYLTKEIYDNPLDYTKQQLEDMKKLREHHSDEMRSYNQNQEWQRICRDRF